MLTPLFLLAALAQAPEPSDHAARAEGRCGACHVDEAVSALPSPVLAGVATRRPVDYLRRFLNDPAQVRPGTSMPDVVPPGDERERTIEALVHFLAADGQRSDAPTRVIDAAVIERGRQLFHDLGCAACHEPFEDAESLAEPIWSFGELAADGASSTGTSAPIGDARRDWTEEGLAEFLRDPLAFHPDGRMPSLALESSEALDLVTYLRFESSVADGLTWQRSPGIGYEYYEADEFPQNGPDWDALAPVASGLAPSFDELPEHAEDWFGFRLRGMVEVPESGVWTFSVVSDDGSMLWIDGELLIDNGGAHATQRRDGDRFLSAGKHAIEVTWFELTGQIAFEVQWEGPNTPEGPLPADALERWTIELAATHTNEPLVVDAALVAAGREHFARLGCANCHPREGLEPAPAARALESPAPAPDAATRLDETLARLNCGACHARGGLGGPAGDRRALFTAATEVDLGDHGRFPPSLENAGAKLTTEWIERILVHGERARPYVRTRMPSYGAHNVAELAELFTEVDAIEPGPAPDVSVISAQIGRELAAADGLGCVQCHYYAGNEPPGGPALDLADTANRVQPDWFRKMLLDPSSVDMEMRMPTMWQEGRSPVTDVLDGDPERQVEAVWAWLANCASLPLPEGLLVPDLEFEVVVGDEPRLVGVFMAGVSPRTLLVGHPEGLHLAYDMQRARLAKAWRGRFFNAKGTWFNRAGSLEQPGSDDVLDLPPGSALARLAAPDAPWPEDATCRPLGRRFDHERRPVFRYALGAVEIEERARPVVDEDGQRLVRELTLRATEPVEDLWLRAAVGDEAHVTVLTGDQPVSVAGPRGRELRIPVRFDEGVAHIELEVSW